MESRCEVLFEPVLLGPVTAPNRFYQVPHCTGVADRAPTDVAAMREMKAMGGWGVVCTENIEISDDADISRYPALHLGHDRDMSRQAVMVDLVHKHGALSGAELAHLDLYSANRTTRRTSFGPPLTSRFAEEGDQEPFVSSVKRITGKQVIGVGRFTSPDLRVSQIKRGILVS